jgi:hypothetical protein
MKEWVEEWIPKKVLESWRSLYLINAERNLRLAQKLIRVLDLLSGLGIKAIPFKGPTLAEQGYGTFLFASSATWTSLFPMKIFLWPLRCYTEKDFFPTSFLQKK